ncbi:MAG: hypothetical protein P8Z78_09340 [Gammaproteobacteria bacterium]|jgi:hypothetical protein
MTGCDAVVILAGPVLTHMPDAIMNIVQTDCCGESLVLNLHQASLLQPCHQTSLVDSLV